MASRIGAASTGIVVAYLTWYFVSRFDEFTTTGLVAVVSLLAGAGVAALIARFTDHKQAFAYYPIGLLLGSVGWIVMRMWIIPGTLVGQATGVGGPAASLVPSDVVQQAPAGTGSSGVILLWAGILALIAVVAVGLVLWRRRRADEGEASTG